MGGCSCLPARFFFSFASGDISEEREGAYTRKEFYGSMSAELIAFIVRRIITATLTVVAVSLLIFLLLQAAPGDPVTTMTAGHKVPQERIDMIRKTLNLDKPIIVQYWLWLKGIFRGDFGMSFIKDIKVSILILERMPVSLQLVLFSGVLTVLLSIPAGIVSALHEGTLLDNVLITLSVITASSPVFVVGLLLIIIFSLWLGWLPPMGLEGLFDVKRLILPCLALSLTFVGLLFRMLRASMIEELQKDYVVKDRAMGLGKGKITARVFKNSLAPVLTVSGFMIGSYIVFAVLVEYVFGLGGIGSLLVNATLTQDYPIVLGLTVFISIVFVISNFLVDLLYGVLDPRIRYTSRK
jgi:peptide/nickel transport system permease protein